MTDWAIGDLALCIANDDDPWTDTNGNPFPGPASGSINEVSGVGRHDSRTALKFEAYPMATFGYDEGFFVKVTPEEEDEFDREVIELMKGGKVKT